MEDDDNNPWRMMIKIKHIIMKIQYLLKFITKALFIPTSKIFI